MPEIPTLSELVYIAELNGNRKEGLPNSGADDYNSPIKPSSDPSYALGSEPPSSTKTSESDIRQQIDQIFAE